MRRAVSFVFLGLCVLTVASTAAAEDIVLYASDATNVQGNWSIVSDASAAGGQMLASADLGWSSTAAPLAAPSDYFEFTFPVRAGTPYHVWLRLRAGGNSKFNDSVFAQFSSAIDPSGNPLYRIGTTDGLFVNRQDCNGCPLSGWGWIDGAYWLSQAATVQFAGDGSQTLRIQTREDGVQLDQVVISSGTYATAAPGQAQDDATIVARPSAPPTGGATPFLGTPAAIPGVVEAENFDNGGEGVAYHDTTAANEGGQYRDTGVDIARDASGSGFVVGWVSAGEWLQYTVNVASAGAYTATFVVASLGPGGTFHLEMNGTDVTGPLRVPDTGDWQNWQNVTKTITLTGGTQRARLVMDTSGQYAVGNFDSIQFTSSAPPSGTSTPYLGAPATVPGVVQVENFDNGGEGIAYHDTSAANEGGQYRNEGVDIARDAAGTGYVVGWVSAGEWLNYTVNVTAGGAYTASFVVASLGPGGTFHLEMNGANVTGTLRVPDTGGWQNWQTVTANVSLNGGTQVARLVMDSAGQFAVGNFDSIQFAPVSTGTPTGGGNVVTVPAGGDLQAAINSAQAGDTILLAPGATYFGAFTLPAKSGNAPITIRSAAPDGALPAAGVRIGPEYVSQMPRIQGSNAGPTFSTAPFAHHYRLMFLEIVNTYQYADIIQFGDGSRAQSSTDVVPHDLTIDRCYIHGDPTNGQKRGVALNSASTQIINSYISDIKLQDLEAQSIDIWNGPGPFTIVNNYLEAAGEVIMVGGADPAIPNLVPADILIQQNHIMKQAAWRSQGWVVKNLVELKNAERVVIDRNVIEYGWASAQLGFAFVLTPVNQDGGAPWVVVQHVQITNNVVRHVAAGLNIQGLGSNTFRMTNDVQVRNNTFVDVSKANWGGPGWFLLTQGGDNIVIDHNTAFADGASIITADVTPVTGFVLTNNILSPATWTIIGSGTAPGNGTISAYYPGAPVAGNVFIGAPAASYPTGNAFPSTVNDVGFLNLGAGDLRLSPSSAYASSATDGGAPGSTLDPR